MTDRVGQLLGNYRVLRLLGRGGFAEVYLGEHLYLRSHAALKVLHTRLGEEDSAQFLREAQALARLTHPHIVRVLDFAVQDGTPFLVMEYAPGGTLRARYPKETRVPLDSIMSYVSQVASAVQYAHDQRLLHRDIKPENMLLNAQDEVLLSDFGLVMLAPSSQSMGTQAMDQAMRGTTPYLAPEQLQGQSQRASDQYALGVVVYEWLCGQRPFRGTPIEIAMQHLSTLPPLREQVPDLSPAIEEVVMRALAKEPKQRFASVQDFAIALQGAVSPFATLVAFPAPGAGVLDLSPGASVPPVAFLPEQPKAETVTMPAVATPSIEQTLNGTPGPPLSQARWKLPIFLTPLIGREQEVVAVCALFSRPEVRLVTLLGTGGIGKTRLAIQVATHMQERFADGVCFVALAPISDPDLVLPTIAQELGIKEGGAPSLVEQVQTFLGEKCLLLLLDNFEQVVSAAPLVEDLLLACPHLSVLVTSREVLHLPGEHLFPVPPLALPDLAHLPNNEDLAQYASVSLFIQRARALQSGFELTSANGRTIAEICVRLDGLPLALELAAARMRVLPPRALLTRLSQRLRMLTGGPRTLEERQQTLRNTIAWSYNLLEAEEQELFRRLAVFVDGCTLEAVEAVMQAVGKAGKHLAMDVLDGVASLIDKSLLRREEGADGEPRFWMLQTLREFGLEMLESAGEAEPTRLAHAQYYLYLAEEAEPQLKGAEQLAWLARLAREQENLRAALGWLLEHGERGLALRLAGALWWFWFMHGDWSEGRRWLEAALQLPSTQGPTLARATALSGAGELAWSLGDHSAAQRLLSESVSLSHELGDDRELAGSLGILGLVLQEQGELAAGRSHVEEGLALCRRLDRTWDLARLLLNAGLTAQRQGHYPQAAALFQEGLPLARALGDRYLIAYGLTYGGTAAFYQGDETQDAALMQEGLTIARELGDKRFLADGLNNLGYLTFLRGDLVQAEAMVQEGLTIARELGHWPSLITTLDTLAQIAHAQGNAEQAAALYLEGFSLAKENGYVVWAGSCLLGLSRVAEAQGQPARAARLLGAAEALIDVNKHMAPIERVAYERDVASVRARLGEVTFAAAWAQGRSMTPEQALAAQETATIPTPATAEALSTPATEASPTYPAGLTAREVEVLRLVAQGMTNHQIAERLIISLHTVNAHVRSIYNKLEVNSRSALTRYAIEQKLL